MGKIKLKRALWNANKGDTIEVSADREKWAVNKGLAEPVIDKIEKVEPKVRGRKKKVETASDNKNAN